MVTTTLYTDFASLLQYPADTDATAMAAHIDRIEAAGPELAGSLHHLREYVTGASTSELEELFTRTFDSNAERALELGWHLHGENYARGAFMARMRGLLRDLEIPESSELPDHLSHVLLVLQHADPTLSRALASGVVSPALSRIQDGFDSEDHPYFGVLATLKRYVDGATEERIDD